MRGVRAQIAFLMAALTLAGCMQTGQQVAYAPRNDLDAMTYGQPTPAARPTATADSGGAIAALQASFAASPRGAYAAPTNAYAAAPVAASRDAAYHLDAGDKLRVVVFGQKGLTNTYAIDAGGESPLSGEAVAAPPVDLALNRSATASSLTPAGWAGCTRCAGTAWSATWS